MRFSTHASKAAAGYRILSVAVIVIGSLVFAGCSRFNGTYETTGPAAGAVSVEFKSGNKAYLTLMGTKVETDYSVDGDNVTFHNVNGTNLVMTVDKDGSLNGPMGMTLKKKN